MDGQTRKIDISTKSNEDAILMIDEEDWDFVKTFTWTPKANQNTTYAIAYDKRRIYLHREVMRARAGEVVDHIDGNGLNNTKGNLRLCTQTQNQHNRKPGHGKSSYKGVFPIHTKTIGMRYKSYITVDGKRINLGTYAKEREAAQAYNEAAIKFFGEFAMLNILI